MCARYNCSAFGLTKTKPVCSRMIMSDPGADPDPSLSRVLSLESISKTQAQAAVNPEPNLGSPDSPQLTGQCIPWSWAHLGPAVAPIPASVKREACWQSSTACQEGCSAPLSSSALAAKPPLAGIKELFIWSFPISCLLQQSSRNTLKASVHLA